MALARTFVVRAVDASEPVSRTSRRVVVHADVLKAAKILAGDVVALSQVDKASEQGEQKKVRSFEQIRPTRAVAFYPKIYHLQCD